MIFIHMWLNVVLSKVMLCTFDCSLVHEICGIKLRHHGKTKKNTLCYDMDDER